VPELGPDGDLVSAMIMTAVLPHLSKLIEGALDPFSGKDIRRLVDIAEEVEVSVEKSNHKFQVIAALS
jgi:GC-rich sequence DNA-binding factor